MDLPDDVVIRRSARRRRTLQARREGDVIVVSVPAELSTRDLDTLVPRLVERVRRREGGARGGGDEELAQRAVRLATSLASDLSILPRLRSVSWSTRQNHRWGSCTPSTGTIRLSSRLRSTPFWVVDYVLFHELVHLDESPHSARFHELVRRFPQHDLAKGFLLGMTYGGQTPPEGIEEPDQLPLDDADVDDD